MRAVDAGVVPVACFTGVTKRQRPKGQRQRPSFQEWQYWLDWGLPEDPKGSVSDKAEQVEEPEAAEVVTGDLGACETSRLNLRVRILF